MYKKRNPFLQFIDSFKGFYDLSLFYNLRKQSFISKLFFAVLSAFLSCLLFFGITALLLNTDSHLNTFLTNLPEFAYYKGGFFCSEKYELKHNQFYLVVDSKQCTWDPDLIVLKKGPNAPIDTSSFHQGSSSDINTYIKNGMEHPSVSHIILISKTNCLQFNTNDLTWKECALSDIMDIFQITTISKLQLMSDYQNIITKLCLLFALYGTLPLTVIFYLGNFLLALLGMGIRTICKSKDRFSTVYWISFYVLAVLSIVQALVMALTKFHLNIIAISSIFLLLYLWTMIRILRQGDLMAEPIIASDVNNDLDVILDEIAFAEEEYVPLSSLPLLPTSTESEIPTKDKKETLIKPDFTAAFSFKDKLAKEEKKNDVSIKDIDKEKNALTLKK